MCRPAGARASGRTAWAARAGRTAARRCRPFHARVSDAAISPSVPPTCTVPAAASARIAPRDRAVERPVHFERAHAVAVALELAAEAGGKAGAPRFAAAAAATDRTGPPAPAAARRCCRSGRRSTISPPSDRSSAASASASRCAPPRGNGQPVVCASAAKTRPTAPVGNRSSGSIACAAMPARSARARGCAKRSRAARRRRLERVHPEPRDRERMPRHRAAARARVPRAAGHAVDHRSDQPTIGVAVVAETRRRWFSDGARRSPPAPRRADAPLGAGGRPIAVHGRRAAACARMATRRPTGGPPNRRRARTRAASAPPTGAAADAVERLVDE